MISQNTWHIRGFSSRCSATLTDALPASAPVAEVDPHAARRDLELLAGAVTAPKRAVGQVLDDVGLTDRAGSKYRTYSLGMKQRPAIAATLLKDPDLLIFDEPTNGLDPAGIREIRQTMRGLAEAGKTALVAGSYLPLAVCRILSECRTPPRSRAGWRTMTSSSMNSSRCMQTWVNLP